MTLSAPGVIGVDVGGSTVRGALWSDDGRMRARRVETTFGREGEPLEAIRSVIADLMAEAVDARVEVASIGVGVPGLVHEGVVEYAANLGWSGIELRALLEAWFAVPVLVDNDARTAAVAEVASRRAIGTEITDLLFIPIGTGIGAAIISDGRVLRGRFSGAGEFGHQVVVPGGESCGCGQRGCVEVYASAVNIAARYRARTGDESATSRDVGARLLTDPAAAAVWTEAIDALAAGITTATVLLDSQVVVVGGGLSRAGDVLIEPLARSVQGRLTWRPTPRVTRTIVGESAGLLGAAWMARPELPTLSRSVR